MHKGTSTTIKALAAAGLLAASGSFASPLVTADWVEEQASDGNVLLVDLRKKEDYDAGHIKGAVSAPYGEFGWRETVDGVVGMLPPLEAINERIGSLGITPDKHVVVIPYGETSSDVGSAARVYWTFRVLGHEHASLLDGGMNAWKSRELYTLETKENSPVPAPSYPGTVDKALLVDTAELVALVDSGAVQPIDARTDEQWEGKKKHPKARVPGSIPTAERLPQADLIDPETGKFLTRDKVVEVASANGWSPTEDRKLVSYCNTGHWASTAWFALSEVAGLEDVRLYDGSMVAWTQDEAHPLINTPSRLEQLVENIKPQ